MNAHVIAYKHYLFECEMDYQYLYHDGYPSRAALKVARILADKCGEE